MANSAEDSVSACSSSTCGHVMRTAPHTETEVPLQPRDETDLPGSWHTAIFNPTAHTLWEVQVGDSKTQAGWSSTDLEEGKVALKVLREEPFPEGQG